MDGSRVGMKPSFDFGRPLYELVDGKIPKSEMIPFPLSKQGCAGHCPHHVVFAAHWLHHGVRSWGADTAWAGMEEGVDDRHKGGFALCCD